MSGKPYQWVDETVEEMGARFGIRATEKLLDEQTPYQHLEVWRTQHWGNLMRLDGVMMLSSLENFVYHEMMSHPALQTHAAPRHVVIIGGGDCGTLTEVLKHREVESVVQIDIDEAVTRAAERFFPELTAHNDDPRVDLRFEDGVAWMRNAPTASVDVIIVDSTDPIGPGTGLFGPDFLADCHRVLRDDGIMVGQSESPFYHMPLMIDYHRAMRDAGFAERRSLLFPQPVYPGGSITGTLARKTGSLDEIRPLAADVATRFYRSELHRGLLAIPPFMQEALGDV
ncbi:polyamine aminopropyltransferase [Guyparkeria halopsychrophila]|uniref:polyamine aminopropyltransferase n=1 Tax=Guyparkeria halopsychrophila TaxID=3139421 RepID=UPI0037CB99EA